ncbi:MAG: hypothetical protein NZM42_13135 [Gemmatales bacterium]|nr:hypothetical protein [Gemmatales bacterium]MDW8222228.1 hypothetical protein [Gemmatales bacterium]
MSALADRRVGEFVNQYFVSSFQKVATFRIVGGQKQGGNVATYFCAPDGRVLHVIPGPVNAETFLSEAQWVVNSVQRGLKENQKTATPFKILFREYHAERLRQQYGLVVEPARFDLETDKPGALTYRDPTGRPLAPVLPPPPLDGPDVKFGQQLLQQRQAAEAALPLAKFVADRAGRRWALGPLAQAHMLLAAHALHPIDKLYGTVFETILGEKISTKPVEIITPFPWRPEGKRGEPLPAQRPMENR